MFRLMILLCVSLAVTLISGDEECATLIEQHIGKCCSKWLPLEKKPQTEENKRFFEEINKCYTTLTRDPNSCELDICIAKAMGYGLDDGTYDEDKVREHLKIQVKEPEIREKIQRNCVDGDNSKYAVPNACPLKRFHNCMAVFRFSLCEEWSDEEKCMDTKSTYEKCTM